MNRAKAEGPAELSFRDILKGIRESELHKEWNGCDFWGVVSDEQAGFTIEFTGYFLPWSLQDYMHT